MKVIHKSINQLIPINELDQHKNCVYALYGKELLPALWVLESNINGAATLIETPHYEIDDINKWFEEHPEEEQACAYVYTKEEVEQMIKHLEYIRDNMED